MAVTATPMLRGPAAVAAARSLGCSEERAAHYAAEGAVLVIDGLPVVAGSSDDELAGTEDVFALALHPDLAGERAAATALALRDAIGPADRVLFRLPPAGAVAAGRRSLVFVDRDLDAAPPAGCDTCTWEAGGDQARPFVLGRLAAAMVAGYADAGRTVSLPQAEAYAAAAFGDVGTPGSRLRSLVLRDGPRTVGHLTLLLDEADELTGRPLTELVDVDLGELSRHTECGLAAARRHLGPDQRCIRGSVVVDGPAGRWRRVHAALAAGGWSDAYSIWELEPR